jgi:hypothetical protein
MRHTIWIINEAGHEYEKALDVVPNAELKPLTVDNINPLQVDRTLNHLAKGIAKYSHSSDYVLVSGTPILSLLVGAIWFGLHEEMQILQWNAKVKKYELSTITERQISALIDKFLHRV